MFSHKSNYWRHCWWYNRGCQQERLEGKTEVICPGPHLYYIINKISKYSNRTVTLIQQSGRYSVDKYTTEIVLTFSLRESNSQNFLQSEMPCIASTVITTEMTPKCSGLFLKNFQQLERYIAIKYKLVEITLKFNFRGSNFQKL